ARFAALAQYVDKRSFGNDERLVTLGGELASYHDVYGIRAGSFYRDNRSMAAAPEEWVVPYDGEARRAFNEALLGRRSHDPP
ncbi:histidine kinase, partial [Streptomyces cinereoruber]